ncbi:MAG: hypothetical protein GOV01_03445 [Candidatus Altiarchaeota archaeon]|nr:hypothetical protein [Candidatus Altiarchaeota archaeon]
MVPIVDVLLQDRKIKRITDIELDRFLVTYEQGYQENLNCMNYVLESFPRWSIVIGYFAMHDISKLLIAKKQQLKTTGKDAHQTVIELITDLVNARTIARLLEDGYEKFQTLSDELDESRQDRVRAQYYLGTPVLEDQWKIEANSFVKKVNKFIEKIEELLG